MPSAFKIYLMKLVNERPAEARELAIWLNSFADPQDAVNAILEYVEEDN